jgi:uncharacterized protein YigA (DUF484 family)
MSDTPLMNQDTGKTESLATDSSTQESSDPAAPDHEALDHEALDHEALNHEALNQEQAAAYLRQHPDLLCRYPELIDQLQWPEDPRATSLSQHQVLRLRQRNQQLELQLQQLAGIAGENERLMQRLHQLTLDLMTADSNVHFIERLFDRLAHDFSAETARLHLIGEHPELAELDCVSLHAGKRPDWFDALRDKSAPYCGRLTREKSAFLFPEVSTDIGSSALIPIAGTGLLAIGSEQENRFHPGVGTLFLELLGTTIAYRLKRAESDDRKSA